MENCANQRIKIRGLKADLKLAEQKLAATIRACPHDWTKPVYDPIRTEGYHIPGDPPGVGGVDHQFAMDVPPKTTPRWKRTCRTCGHVEETTRTVVSEKISECSTKMGM